jgi:hypothetical protein
MVRTLTERKQSAVSNPKRSLFKHFSMPSVHQLSHANSDSHAIAYLDHVLQHTQFFQKYAGNAGVKTASLGTESFTIARRFT